MRGSAGLSTARRVTNQAVNFVPDPRFNAIIRLKKSMLLPCGCSVFSDLLSCGCSVFPDLLSGSVFFRVELRISLLESGMIM